MMAPTTAKQTAVEMSAKQLPRKRRSRFISDLPVRWMCGRYDRAGRDDTSRAAPVQTCVTPVMRAATIPRSFRRGFRYMPNRAADAADFDSTQDLDRSRGASIGPRLSLMMFLQYAVWGAWLPILGRYLSAHLHFSPGEIGTIAGTAGAVGAILAPFIAGQVA